MSNFKNKCCPKFNPEKWDEITSNWKDKLFIKDSVPTFFHIPFPPMLGKKITNMMRIAENSKKLVSSEEDILLLFTDPHPFKSELYLSTEGYIPDAKNTTISGKYFSKVFDGPYNAIPKFIKQMDEYLNKKKLISKKYFVHYAYCPKCSKEAKHNYMVLFAKI